METNILVLTGASGVGKTSIMKELSLWLPEEDFEFHYFDSIGIPSSESMISAYGSCEEWQRAKTHEWIKRLLNKPTEKTILFEGQMNLAFIIEGFKNNAFDNYKIVLIDCSDKEMRRRLVEERKQPELANNDMSNWLKYMRNQAIQANIEVVDTTGATIDESTAAVMGLL